MKRLLACVIAAGLISTACSNWGEPEAITQDREAAAANLDRLNDSQPIPEFRWSQIRQNLIDINNAQADTTQTTSFFFNMGVTDPIAECPSIGFPIPTTAQLTNPQQRIPHHSLVIQQAEQTGIYTGDSTGTYVICVNAQGEAYAQYWEGFVNTVTGPAEWSDGRIRLIGPPSFEFSTGDE